jgi:hypothetical protein
MEASDYRELESRTLESFFHPMDLGDGLVMVDTTDFEPVDYDGIANAVRAALE